MAWASILGMGCSWGERPAPLFESLPADQTGVTFVNDVPDTPEFNIINYLNHYNGGGVAAGDVDGDGRPDLYFTSNLGTDRLYRNAGDFQFEDVTELAGVGTAEGWKSGVAMADVNGDGHLDIYVSTVSHLSLRGANVLYVNDGDGTFTDRTAEYGLEHTGYSTQAAFLDYDMDGDLDMYLLNHSTHEIRGSAWNPLREDRHPEAGDRLFRNDGARFADVSDAAGIYGGVEGYGLGVVPTDVNLDGCPDLFVANDFHEGDFLYFNNCDGTFTESIATATGHTSKSSMGVDAADFNNDGRPDLAVLDMLPVREDILKTSSNAEDMTVYNLKQEAGYHHQFARNTLQLNRGHGLFSDIGYLAGVHATDWSWTPLWADLDNDGNKDLFVTNGIPRRPNDLDFIDYVAARPVQALLQEGFTQDVLEDVLARMPHVPLANYAFRNNGDLTFTDMADAWGLAEPGFSNGAAYVDLDGDGALDLVVNNVRAPASIYRNLARTVNHHHYLAVQLRGAGRNTAGIGAKVFVTHDGVTQLVEQIPTRGFQSSVDSRLHFGLGVSAVVDSVLVVWPDRRYQVVTDVSVDQTLTLEQDEAAGRYAYNAGAGQSTFDDITDQLALGYRHEENQFFDYTREPLIPHQLSTEGPALAVGDVNGDGLDDVYAGGAKWQAGQLLVQRGDGTFWPADEAAFRLDSINEDVDAAFFDADGDGNLDLYVVSGGNEFWGERPALLDRLYLNDGSGGFRRFEGLLPAVYQNGSCVVPGDFDGDGDVDLFVGGRVVARRYGASPRSYLFENDGTGHFRDVSSDLAPDVAMAGMVTSARWVDYDRDGGLDLVVAGEWMPVRVFRQEEGRFVERTAEVGLSETAGWWNTIEVADLDDDGRPDLILGNLGRNSFIQASPEEPARLYVHDFAGSGTPQHFLTFYKNAVSYPIAGRDEVLRAVPALSDRYPSYADFGASRIEEIFPRSVLRDAELLEAYRFESVVAWNDGDGVFRLAPLPTEAQFAPVHAVLPEDFDRDGNADVVVAGNFFGVPTVRGRYDASYGLLLLGDGAGGWTPVDMQRSNLVLRGEVRDLELASRAGGARLLVVARNDNRLQILRTP